MTPLERMATAIDEQITQIYGSPPDRGEGAKIARAALLALAEAELPESVVDSDEVNQAMCELDSDVAFRLMCRAIAEDRG